MILCHISPPINSEIISAHKTVLEFLSFGWIVYVGWGGVGGGGWWIESIMLRRKKASVSTRSSIINSLFQTRRPMLSSFMILTPK